MFKRKYPGTHRLREVFRHDQAEAAKPKLQRGRSCSPIKEHKITGRNISHGRRHQDGQSRSGSRNSGRRKHDGRTRKAIGRGAVKKSNRSWNGRRKTNGREDIGLIQNSLSGLLKSGPIETLKYHLLSQGTQNTNVKEGV